MHDLSINWAAILPHVILCAVACLVLVVSAGRQGRAGSLTLWVCIAGCAAALVAAWMMKTGAPAFAGSVAVDGISRIVYVLLAFSALMTPGTPDGGRWRAGSTTRSSSSPPRA